MRGHWTKPAPQTFKWTLCVLLLHPCRNLYDMFGYSTITEAKTAQIKRNTWVEDPKKHTVLLIRMHAGEVLSAEAEEFACTPHAVRRDYCLQHCNTAHFQESWQSTIMVSVNDWIKSIRSFMNYTNKFTVKNFKSYFVETNSKHFTSNKVFEYF